MVLALAALQVMLITEAMFLGSYCISRLAPPPMCIDACTFVAEAPYYDWCQKWPKLTFD